ncbi:Integral membrane protein TerC [Patulibacter medicamentivorans]|uniref:Integral membrane protein TerC n=1 Tax=Patulibacter medicamentivorans TaxID=1097667 RepID=H0E6D7_9ACTN|nr:TerC family protein [Patulibacter medicamentivorans]EHN10781.1 Integral membrane protein TerC [Patulibacter medicamentivorans]
MSVTLLASASTENTGSEVSPVIWIAFTAFIVAMLALDVFVHRHSEGDGEEDSHVPPFRESVIWSIGWTVLAVAFTAVVPLVHDGFGGKQAGEFITGYVIERSLSLDNLFVFTILFGFFSVPLYAQRKVLFYGIIGAIVLRAIFILVGGALLNAFHWMIYVFGAFLVITAIRMATHSEEEVHPENNPILKLIRRVFPLSDSYDGSKIFTIENGKRIGTPMLAALAMVATFDVIFAIDSIPAIFAVTRETFIVFAANAFALLGLTSLFFLIAGLLERFHYLHYGLAFILGFVGIKMLLSDVWHMPIGISLGVIIGTLLVAAWASNRWPKEHDDGGSDDGAGGAPPAVAPTA